MKLIQLKYFQTVCYLGNNITRASETLHVTQPCISNAIVELEREFGVKLFQRVHKRLQLTKEGEKCLLSVEDILRKAENLSEQMSDLAKKKKYLNIGVTSMIGSLALPELLTEFQNAYPDIRLEIHELLTVNIVRLLENEILDLAIINTKSMPWANTTMIDVIPLYDIEYMFCTYPDNPLAKEPFVTYEMIVNEPLILLKSENTKDVIAVSRFTEHGLKPNVLFYLNQIDTLKSFIRKKCASSFLFNDMILPDSGLVGISFKEKDISSTGLAFKKNRYITNVAATFIEFTQKYPLKNN